MRCAVIRFFVECCTTNQLIGFSTKAVVFSVVDNQADAVFFSFAKWMMILQLVLLFVCLLARNVCFLRAASFYYRFTHEYRHLAAESVDCSCSMKRGLFRSKFVRLFVAGGRRTTSAGMTGMRLYGQVVCKTGILERTMYDVVRRIQTSIIL